MKKTNKKGFTIVELVIVIAVIAILAGVMIPTFSGIIKTANKSNALQVATAAYKEAYGVAISDGKIQTATTGADGKVTTTNEETVETESGYTFKFKGDSIDADKLTVTVTKQPSGEAKEWDISVAAGVLSVVEHKHTGTAGATCSKTDCGETIPNA